MVPYNSASPQAAAIGDVFNVVLVVSAVILLIVTAGVLVAAWRFRAADAGKDDPSEPAQVTGNRMLEIVWIGVPLALLLSVAGFTAGKLNLIQPPAPDAPEPEIVITGHQWWWDVAYPQAGFRTANEIHIPAGRPVLVRLESGDVIHSFWVPELGGKADMIPGHPVYHWLQADAPGVYEGACTEFCGAEHAWMRLRVVAQTDAAYTQWLTAQAQTPITPTAGDAANSDAADGARIFLSKSCVNCHAIQGTSAQAQVGPDLTHFGSRDTLGAGILKNTPDNLAQWLADPQSVKPGVLMPDLRLDDSQIQKLVAYLEALK